MTTGDVETARRADFGIRQAVIAATGRSMLVEAAAGTGKTTLMIDRMLSGLRAGQFRLPEAVAITFTEKAAGELEARLRRELTRRARRRDLPEQERRNLARAIEEIDQSHVSTIHSFCASLLRERPVEAGVDPQFEVLDGTRASLLKEHCWDSWMGEQIHACEPALVDALRAGISISALPGRGAGLKTLADAIVESAEVLDPALFTLGRPDRPVAELLRELKARARRAAEFIRANIRGNGNADSRAARDLAERIAASPPDDTPALRAAAYAACVVTVDRTLTSFPKDQRMDAGATIGGLVDTAGEIAPHLACGLLAWLGGFVEFYRAEKRRRSVLDFRDLLLCCANLLRSNKDMRRYFKDRFQAFFVDEFQDTDPIQAEIIAFLCEKKACSADRPEDVELSEGKLFVVGDPKQSIYRFRKADVQVYEQFKRLFGRLPGGASSVRVVSQNFRSSAPLVQSLNAIFERVLAVGADEREGVYQARHVALVPGRDGGGGGPSIIAVYPPGGSADELRAGEARELEARCLAGVVRQLVEGEASPAIAGALGGEVLSYGSFACLLRALTDVDIYEEAFDAFHIPYRVVGGRTYYQREEIGETLVLLRAVDDPLDQVAIVGALRSSYFAVSDEDLFLYRDSGGEWDYLHTPVFEGPAGEAMKLLAQWHQRRNRVPPHVLLREILDQTKALEAFMLKPAGEQRLANVQKLTSQLRSLHAASGRTFRSIIAHLAALHERQEPESESSMVEPGDDFVQFMSIHKAKGLQFDAVCLPDLSRGMPTDVGPLLVDRVGRKAELSAGKGICSRGYERLAELERENILAEQKRLLYVAATRAGRLLVLPLYWQAPGKNCMLGLLAGTGMFAGADEAPFGEERGGVFYWDTRLAPRAPPERTETAGEAVSVEDLLARRAQWKQEHDQVVLRASCGTTIVVPSMLVEGAVGERGGPLDEAGGREFGSLFHNVMRRMPMNGPEAQIETFARALAALEAAELGLEDDEADLAAGLAVELMRNDRFNQLLREAQVVRQEVPFAVPLGRLRLFHGEVDGLLEGRVDLVLVSPQRTTILDYKTDRLGERSADEAAAAYWPQLALYALALEACGWCRGRVELALCFVRGCVLCSTALDPALLDETKQRTERALSGGGKDSVPV